MIPTSFPCITSLYTSLTHFTSSSTENDYSKVKLKSFAVDFIASSSGVAVEKQAPLQALPDPTTNLPEDEIKPLSGNPYYHAVILKSHLHHRYLMGPSSNLIKILPSAEVPTVLSSGGKSWHMMYRGHAPGRKFFDGRWRNFADDNCLKEGDACIFELMENSQEKLVFEVQILRGDIPSVFLEREETIGRSAEVPILID